MLDWHGWIVQSIAINWRGLGKSLALALNSNLVQRFRKAYTSPVQSAYLAWPSLRV